MFILTAVIATIAMLLAFVLAVGWASERYLIRVIEQAEEDFRRGV